MKKYWTFTIVGLILSVAIPLGIIYGPRILLPSQCSPLYQRYYNVPGIKASYVKGFPVNDTLAIDVTLLRATDSASWERLMEELQIPAPKEDTAKTISEGKSSITLYMAKKGSASEESDPNPENNDVVGVSYQNRSIGIYHTNGAPEIIAVVKYNIRTL